MTNSPAPGNSIPARMNRTGASNPVARNAGPGWVAWMEVAEFCSATGPSTMPQTAGARGRLMRDDLERIGRRVLVTGGTQGTLWPPIPSSIRISGQDGASPASYLRSRSQQAARAAIPDGRIAVPSARVGMIAGATDRRRSAYEQAHVCVTPPSAQGCGSRGRRRDQRFYGDFLRP